MKKVLFVATITGHINAFHLPYLEMFKKNGYEVSVATGDSKNVNNFCDKKIQIQIKRNPLKLDNIKAIFNLKKIIEKEKYDIIHCHTPMGSVVARLAAKAARKKYGIRIIYTAHGFHFYKGAPLKNWILFYPVEKLLSKYTDSLITINMEDYKLAKKKFKKCKDIEYVPGVGIDKNKFDIKLGMKNKENIIKKLGVNKKAFILTCVARMDKNKNQLFLINCMKKIVEIDNNIHLLLVGSDELNGYYQNIVKEKKLNNNIHFLGHRDDIPELLNVTNIIVSASKREGLPVNIIEAFACGIPVVVLNCRGMKDLIEDNINGFILQQDDIDGFINKIIFLKNNKNEWSKISKNNKKKSKFYYIENIINDYKEIYDLK
ncbi:MAG: glycosyltransferase family 4 protein [bacterium]|nr:glycosyltransferase family 4 protein [bacterium]